MTNIMTLPLATALRGHTQGENYSHAHVPFGWVLICNIFKINCYVWVLC